MVRGHAKAEAQKKRLAKDAVGSKKHSAEETKAIRENGLTMKCPHCMQSMPNAGVLKNHFENKHPKVPMPPELANA